LTWTIDVRAVEQALEHNPSAVMLFGPRSGLAGDELSSWLWSNS
jgi:hypothetical protein